MIANADMTIYNKYYDRVLEKDVYCRTFLYDINWQGSRAVTVSDKGLLSADLTEVLIDRNVTTNKIFMKPKEWAKSTQKDQYFTLNAGDVIVRGIVDFDLTGVKPNNLDGLKNTYDDVFTIISVVDLTDTSLPHWEVGAK